MSNKCKPFVAYNTVTLEPVDNAKPKDILSGKVAVMFKPKCDKKAALKLAKFAAQKAGASDLYFDEKDSEYYIKLVKNGFTIDIKIPEDQVSVMAISTWIWLTPDKQLKSIKKYNEENKNKTEQHSETEQEKDNTENKQDKQKEDNTEIKQDKQDKQEDEQNSNKGEE